MAGEGECMSDDRRIRVGIIGCGTIAVVRHLPEYAARDDVEIAALYNRTRSKAEEVSRQYGGTVFDSVEELIASDIDAVSICTANSEHARDAVLALRAGKHVLCEKPMDVTPENCTAMTEEAERAGKLLMIAHNQRFSAAHVKARELIAAGEIGRVLSFDTKFGHSGPEIWTGTADTWFFRKSAAGMGVLADLGIHKTDLIHYLTGEYIAEVYAHAATIDKRYPDGNLIEVDDNAWCIYRLGSGATGTMHVSWTNYGKEYNSIVINGTEGSVRCYDDREYSLILEKKDGRTNFFSTEGMQRDIDPTVGTGKNWHSGVIDEFIDCIRTGRPCRCSGREALSAMRVIFAALESTRSGHSVEIPENQQKLSGVHTIHTDVNTISKENDQMKEYAFGIDIGGTTVKMGLFSTDGVLLESWEIPTRKEEAGSYILPDIADAMKAKIEEKGIALKNIKGVGIDVPGPIIQDSIVNRCVNLGWGVYDVTKELGNLIGIENIKVANDANAAALGEMWKGGGEGHKDVVMITLGTGVGGGVIVDGKIVGGHFGAGGEIGHMLVNRFEERPCGCGKAGHLEQYASATGIVRRAKDVLAMSDRPSTLRDLTEITAKDVFDHAKQGDVLSLEIVDFVGQVLGGACSMISAVVDPEIFVIGGGVSKAGDILINSIRKYFRNAAFHASEDARFALAKLGNDAGMFGAVKMVLD